MGRTGDTCGDGNDSGILMDSLDHSATRLQQQCNRKTRGNHDSFESHRQQVTSILVAAGQRDQPGDQTLLILGVGNGNDVDLDVIATCYRSITLADIDIEAVNHCMSQLCLLYTSPSPRDATLSRMPSSA